MYCPGCGIESTRGLSYCSRCGTNLNTPAADRQTPSPHPHPKVTAMFLGVTLLSVIIIIAIFVTIANVGLPPPFLTAVIIAGCGAAFGIIALLIQFLLRLTGLSRPAAIQYGPGFTGKEPEAITPGALRQIPQPQAFGSVTENTTRSFPAPERTQREQ